MNHIPVKSSSLKSLGHDPATNTVVARFNCPLCKGTGASKLPGLSCEKCGGKGYVGDNHYSDVPQQTFHEVLTDPVSVGRAFNARISRQSRSRPEGR